MNVKLRTLEKNHKHANFQAIRGIGPGIEEYLVKAGIVSYEQMADSSPEALFSCLHDLPGMSLSRITKQDWIGQAQALVPKKRKVAPKADGTEDKHMHYSTFTVKIALDDENIPHHTLVIDNKNGEKHPMAGWDGKSLLAFIAAKSGLELSAENNPKVFPPPAPSAETTSLPVSSLSNETRLDLPALAAVEETALEILSPESPVLEPPLVSPASSRPEIGLRFALMYGVQDQDASPRRRLKANMPFSFILKLKLTGFEELGDRQIPYRAMVNAQRVSSQDHLLAGSNVGLLPPQGDCTIEVKSRQIPVGAYRLDATVELDREAVDCAETSVLKAEIAGPLLQIY